MEKLDLESVFLGSAVTEATILALEFFSFYVVYDLMGILALLPMLYVCKKLK